MKKNSEIVFILPNFSKGGAERVVSILALELLNLGYKVKILLLFGEKIAFQLPEKAEVETMGLNKVGKTVRVLKLRNKLKMEKKKYNKIILIPFLNSVLNTVVVSNLFLGNPVIASERSNPYLRGGSLMKRIRYSIPFWFSKRAVFQTIEARKYFFIPDRKAMIIPNPILTSPCDWEGRLEDCLLITTCRLHPAKNLKMMVDVVNKLRYKYSKIKLHIYGDGPLKTEIDNYILDNNLSDSVFLLGVDDNVYSKLSQASVFISTSDYEGISNSMLEAMSVGMPLVCTDCPIGGTKAMLSDGCGLLSPIGDVDSFAQQIDYVLTHPEGTKQMAKRAKEKTIKYSPSSIALEWDRLFSSLI
jgi:glycosyltransferase involved in cell wall biosynthesis